MRVWVLNFGYELVFAKLPRNQNLEVELASCIYELEVTICSPCETFHCRSHRNSCRSQNLPPQSPLHGAPRATGELPGASVWILKDVWPHITTLPERRALDSYPALKDFVSAD